MIGFPANRLGKPVRESVWRISLANQSERISAKPMGFALDVGRRTG
jgi:hypothetical protein